VIGYTVEEPSIAIPPERFDTKLSLELPQAAIAKIERAMTDKTIESLSINEELNTLTLFCPNLFYFPSPCFHGGYYTKFHNFISKIGAPT
jgi:hypothetical protein